MSVKNTEQKSGRATFAWAKCEGAGVKQEEEGKNIKTSGIRVRGTWRGKNLLGKGKTKTSPLQALDLVLERVDLTAGFFRGVFGSVSSFLFVLRPGLGIPLVGTSQFWALSITKATSLTIFSHSASWSGRSSKFAVRPAASASIRRAFFTSSRYRACARSHHARHIMIRKTPLDPPERM